MHPQGVALRWSSSSRGCWAVETLAQQVARRYQVLLCPAKACSCTLLQLWSLIAANLPQIKQLCPYQGVLPAPYPPTLLTCSQADLRVPYWGPLKHAARLRAVAAAHASSSGGGSRGRQCGPILLLPDGQSGHFVHERDLYTTKAEQYAFLIEAVEGRLQPAS